MFEADALCERVAVINHGKIVALDTPEGLERHAEDLHIVEVEVFGIAHETVDQPRQMPKVDTVSVKDRDQKQALLIHSRIGSAIVPQIMQSLDGNDIRLGKVTVREPTLEDAYVRLVGGEAWVSFGLLCF
jgi:ABC-2 type transport system ATP-binding protein